MSIELAKEHRDQLNRYVSETFAIEGNRPRCGLKFEPDTGDYVLFVNYVPDLGDFLRRCSFKLREGLNSLRSALDYLTYQLAILHTAGNIKKPRALQFPICDTPSTFEEFKRRHLKEIDPTHIAIMETFQRYNGVTEKGCPELFESITVPDGKGSRQCYYFRIRGRIPVEMDFHPLSGLRDLADPARHRFPLKLVVPTDDLHGFSRPSFSFAAFAGTTKFVEIMNTPSLRMPAAELNTEVMRVNWHGARLQPNMDVACYVTPKIAIDRGEPAIETFDKIAATVIKIVREFEPFF